MKAIITTAFILLYSFAFCQNIDAQTKIDTTFTFSNGEIISSSNCKISGEYYLCNKSYDLNIIGTYFFVDSIKVNPRLNEFPLKTSGVTYVKFNSENGEIKQGDPITSSSIPGVGMKATEKGIILGVALEDAKGKEGLIMIRILIQYFTP